MEIQIAVVVNYLMMARILIAAEKNLFEEVEVETLDFVDVLNLIVEGETLVVVENPAVLMLNYLVVAESLAVAVKILLAVENLAVETLH